jgi:hypothetical protein
MSQHAWLDGPAYGPGQERIVSLLDRYPNISRDEAQEILTFLQAGSYFDVGLLTGDARLKPSLDAFVKDHRRHFDVEPDRAEAVVGIGILVLFLLWAIWAVLT